MTTKLITEGIWRRITHEAHKSRGDVVVAYFGSSGGLLLPLKSGSNLVVDMSLNALRSGQTNPHEILKLIKKGVNIYSFENLHSKVFTFDRKAFIGSTNVSSNSAFNLKEAVIETDAHGLVAQARSYVHSLMIDPVTHHFARSLLKEYKPPRFNTRRRKTSTQAIGVSGVSPVRIINVGNESYSDDEEKAADKGRPLARQKLHDTKYSMVENICVYEGRVQPNEFVIQLSKGRDGRYWLSPPGRVVYIQNVASSPRSGKIIFLEIGRRRAKIMLSKVRGKIRSEAFDIYDSNVLLSKRNGHILMSFWSPDKS